MIYAVLLATSLPISALLAPTIYLSNNIIILHMPIYDAYDGFIFLRPPDFYFTT